MATHRMVTKTTRSRQPWPACQHAPIPCHTAILPYWSSCAIMRHHAPLCAIMRHHASSRAIMRHHAPSCAVMRHHAPSCAIMRHHAPSCAVMRRHAPSCVTMRRHAPSCVTMHQLATHGTRCSTVEDMCHAAPSLTSEVHVSPGVLTEPPMMTPSSRALLPS